MFNKLKLYFQFLELFCSMTLTGLSLVFAIYLAVNMALRTQTHVYLTVLMPSGEGVSLLVMLICGALTGAIATKNILKSTAAWWATIDSCLKTALSFFVAYYLHEIKVLNLLVVFSAIYVLSSVVVLLTKKL